MDDILALTGVAFPGEELRPLVRALLGRRSEVLPLVGVRGRQVCAYGIFTLCGPAEAPAAGALLGPLAVAPTEQRRGWGSAVIHFGRDRLEAAAVRQIFVLGDPRCYGRFGFAPERRCMPPHPLPAGWADAWQSLILANRAPLPAGPLRLPEPWMDRALWLP